MWYQKWANISLFHAWRKMAMNIQSTGLSLYLRAAECHEVCLGRVYTLERSVLHWFQVRMTMQCKILRGWRWWWWRRWWWWWWGGGRRRWWRWWQGCWWWWWWRWWWPWWSIWEMRIINHAWVRQLEITTIGSTYTVSDSKSCWTSAKISFCRMAHGVKGPPSGSEGGRDPRWVSRKAWKCEMRKRVIRGRSSRSINLDGPDSIVFVRHLCRI